MPSVSPLGRRTAGATELRVAIQRGEEENDVERRIPSEGDSGAPKEARMARGAIGETQGKGGDSMTDTAASKAKELYLTERRIEKVEAILAELHKKRAELLAA